MDPTATLKRIFDELANQDWEEAFYACLDLQTWLNKGGVQPENFRDTSSADLLGFLRVVKKECKRLSLVPE